MDTLFNENLTSLFQVGEVVEIDYISYTEIGIIIGYDHTEIKIISNEGLNSYNCLQIMGFKGTKDELLDFFIERFQLDNFIIKTMMKLTTTKELKDFIRNYVQNKKGINNG